ncbi:hypothetical protein [Halomonas heilongjiangensis]|nr:hypothetical protein [Halomonas heilongjiangensis]PXX93145.1 hypothetical protein CR158_05530 [Halomonas heilongjiangensis]
MSDLTKTLWGQFMTAFNDQMKIEGVPQMLTGPQPWNWGGKNPPIGSIPYQQVQFLNIVPASPLVDPNTYGMKLNFGQQYKAFLNSLMVTDGGDEGQSLQQAIINATQDLGRVQANVNVAYQNFQEQTGSTESFADWLENEGIAVAAQLQQAKTAYQTAQSTYDEYMKKLKGPITDAVKQYNDNLSTVVGQAGTTLKDQPVFQLSETPWSYIQRITNDNYGGDASAGSARTFTLSSSTQEWSDSTVYAEGELGGLFDFFGFEAAGRVEKVSTEHFSSEYDITFAFQDVSVVNVTPENWFDSSMPSNYVNGPFMPGHSGFKDGNDVYYFGKGGNLARIVSQVIVGYRPTITINAGSDFAEEVKQKISGEGGFFIGPFEFGGAGGSDSDKGTIKVDGQTITCTSNSNWGTIVGLGTNWLVNPR